MASSLGDDLKIDDADKELKTGRVLGAGGGVVSEGMYRHARGVKAARIKPARRDADRVPPRVRDDARDAPSEPGALHGKRRTGAELPHPHQAMAAGSLGASSRHSPDRMSAHSSRALSLAKDVGAARSYTFTTRIIHGDLKSDNILLDMNWNGKIATRPQPSRTPPSRARRARRSGARRGVARRGDHRGRRRLRVRDHFVGGVRLD